MKKHTAQDCSTPTTRLRLKGYVNPHHDSIRELLDEERYTLNTFRINNGSNYLQRKYNSENAIYDYEAYGDELDTELNPPEIYGDGLILDEQCSQGAFQKIPNYQNPCQ